MDTVRGGADSETDGLESPKGVEGNGHDAQQQVLSRNDSPPRLGGLLFVLGGQRAATRTASPVHPLFPHLLRSSRMRLTRTWTD
eukprot:2691767-Pyramimonas_sp.AAC.1